MRVAGGLVSCESWSLGLSARYRDCGEWAVGARPGAGLGTCQPPSWHHASDPSHHYVESRKCLVFSALKRPTISTLFQRPSEGVGKCDFRVTAGGGKKMMAIPTTKGVTAATHTS
jgi:hypothetical protein